MHPDRVNFLLFRNVPFEQEFTFLQENGLPYDFTGWSGRLQLRVYGGASGSALIDLQTVTTAVQGIRFLASGTIRIHIDAASINTLPAATTQGESIQFYHDLVLTDPTSFSQLFWEGAAVVAPGVTVLS